MMAHGQTIMNRKQWISLSSRKSLPPVLGHRVETIQPQRSPGNRWSIVDRVGVTRTTNINCRNDYSDRKRERNWDSPRRIVGSRVEQLMIRGQGGMEGNRGAYSERKRKGLRQWRAKCKTEDWNEVEKVVLSKKFKDKVGYRTRG